MFRSGSTACTLQRRDWVSPPGPALPRHRYAHGGLEIGGSDEQWPAPYGVVPVFLQVCDLLTLTATILVRLESESNEYCITFSFSLILAT